MLRGRFGNNVMIFFNLSIVLIAVLALFNMFKTLKNDYDYLNRDSTATIRGVAILGIVLHHIALHTDYDVNKIPLVNLVINECGFPCTAIFFFFSGFGCWLSLNKLSSLDSTKKAGGVLLSEMGC